MEKIAVSIILTLLYLAAVSVSSGAYISPANTGFDMKGTITGVLSPDSIVVGDVAVHLEGVNATGLHRSAYIYLMEDLKSYYMGKDVLVKGNYAYFDLHGSYNSKSINEMIQKRISDLEVIQWYRMADRNNFSLPYPSSSQ